jgi:hypothetical protein
MSVGIEVKFDLSDVKKDLDAQINDIFRKVLQDDIPRILRDHDLEDPDSYTLLLKNRGATRRRQLRTIRPEYLKLGNGQPEFKFVTGEGNYEQAIEAAAEALQMAVRRAPYRSGDYARHLGYFVGGGNIFTQMSTYGLRKYPFQEGDSIFITSPVKYASVIEAGFFRGYYETQDLKGGILHYVAKDIAGRFGNRVAVSFEYRSINGGTFPVIRIGPLGSFSPRFDRPGSAAAKRRRRQR